MSQLPCSDCATGTLHAGTPTGHVETLHGLPTYIAEPPSGTSLRGIVVILPDAFGWELPNSRILADNYASKGKFTVLLPEFMDGHWMSHDVLTSMETVIDNKAGILSRVPSGLRAISGFVPFLFFTRAAVVGPRIYSFFRALRTSNPSMSVGCAGFCWGGKWVTLLVGGREKAADGQFLVECGFTAHSSALDIPADLEKVVQPLSIAHASLDFALGPAAFKTMKQVMDQKSHCELVVYEGAKHGFAVRGNPNDEKEKRQGMEAEEQALRWFEKHLVRKSKL